MNKKVPKKINKKVPIKKTQKSVADKSIKRQKEDELVNPQLINKTKNIKEKQTAKNKFYYSFLTIILLICLIQIGFSGIINLSKTISYQAKIVKIRKEKQQAEEKNNYLKQEIENFSSVSTLEAIARNNLKMAGDKEVLIIISHDEDNIVPTLKNDKKKKKRLWSN